MTKNDLKQIFYIDKEIMMWEKELEDIRERSLMKSKEITDMPFANTNVLRNPVEELSIQMYEIESVICKKKLLLEKKRAEIYRFIETVDDSIVSMIIKYRCCDLKSWSDVGTLMNQSGDNCRKIFNRFLKTLKAKEDCESGERVQEGRQQNYED